VIFTIQCIYDRTDYFVIDFNRILCEIATCVLPILILTFSRWDSVYGDRFSELVCIGIDMDKKLMVDELNKACLTDKEFEAGPEAWKNYEDAFFEGEIKQYFEFAGFEDEEEGEDEHAGHNHA